MTIKEFSDYRNKQMIQSYYEGEVTDRHEEHFVNSLASNPIDLYIDIGCNRGDVADMFVGPDTDSLLFEPDLRMYNISKYRFWDDKNCKLFNNCIGKTKGRQKFYYHADDSTQGSLTYRDVGAYRWSKVRCLDAYMGLINLPTYSTIVIKIDTEGNERDVLEGMQKILALNKSIIILMEYSFKWLASKKETHDAFMLLRDNGFTSYKLTAFGLEQLPGHTAHYLDNIKYATIVMTKNFNLQVPEIEMASYDGWNKFRVLFKDFEITAKGQDIMKGPAMR